MVRCPVPIKSRCWSGVCGGVGYVESACYVVREEGMLRSEAAFQAGRVTVNGKPIGRPAGGAPDQPVAAAPM